MTILPNFSLKHIKIFAQLGDKGKPIPNPSLCLYKFPLKIKKELRTASSSIFLNKLRVKPITTVAELVKNIFICFKEKLWLDQCPNEFAPVLYKRYIDDTFVLFRCKSHAQKFHDYLNNCHNNIKFTMELESNDCLPFLDCNVSRE